MEGQCWYHLDPLTPILQEVPEMWAPPQPQTVVEAGGQPWGPGAGAPLYLSWNYESPVCVTWSTDGFLNGQPQIQPSAQCRPRVGGG